MNKDSATALADVVVYLTKMTACISGAFLTAPRLASVAALQIENAVAPAAALCLECFTLNENYRIPPSGGTFFPKNRQLNRI